MSLIFLHLNFDFFLTPISQILLFLASLIDIWPCLSTDCLMIQKTWMILFLELSKCKYIFLVIIKRSILNYMRLLSIEGVLGDSQEGNNQIHCSYEWPYFLPQAPLNYVSNPLASPNLRFLLINATNFFIRLVVFIPLMRQFPNFQY